MAAPCSRIVTRSVATKRSIAAVVVSGGLPCRSRRARMAIRARADSDIPERIAKSLKRAFSAAEGRAVMDGNDGWAVRSLMLECSDLLQTRTLRYPATNESTSNSEAHMNALYSGGSTSFAGSAADDARQPQGQSLLGWHARSSAVHGRADRRCRLRYQLCDCRSRDKSPAAQNDAREPARSKQLVDRITGDATQQLPRLFDRVKLATVHGSFTSEWRVSVIRGSTTPVASRFPRAHRMCPM